MKSLKTPFLIFSSISAILLAAAPVWSWSTHAGFPEGWGGQNPVMSLHLGPAWNTEAYYALGTWNTIPGSTFEFFYNYDDLDQCEVDNYLCGPDDRFGNAVRFDNFSNGVCCNESLPWCDPDDAKATTFKWGYADTLDGHLVMCEADILVNSAYEWTTQRTYRHTGQPYYFRPTILHELGHALGLTHENGRLTIMNTNSHATPYLHPDEMAAVRSIYGLAGPGPYTDVGATVFKKNPSQDVPHAESIGFPASANTGDTIRVQWTPENFGLEESCFDVGFYLSLGFVGEEYVQEFIPSANSILLDTVRYCAAPESSQTQTSDVTIPASVGAGEYHLCVSMDISQELDELNEFNNGVCYYNYDGRTKTFSYRIAISDASAPTPNRMEWEREPYADSMTSLSMTAATASDPTGPVIYEFRFVSSPTGGAGGTSSTARVMRTPTDRSYTDSGLEPNHRYSYRVRAGDGEAPPNYTIDSEIAYAYTHIEPSTGVLFWEITPTMIKMRSRNTPSNLDLGQSGLIIHNIDTGDDSGWKQSNSYYWNSTNLTPNTLYSFAVLTRNGDGVVSVGMKNAVIRNAFTLANPPSAGSTSSVGCDSITVRWGQNGNPLWTEYFCENTSTGGNSGWITGEASGELAWTSTGLGNQRYSFRVKARNGDGVETFWTDLGTCGLDCAPPQPDPMQWDTAHGAVAGTTSITMHAAEAVDASPPVQYFFDFILSTTGGGGGTDSAWRTSRSYKDTGLSPNHHYRYRVRARDNDSPPRATQYSKDLDIYTAIETPAGITFGEIMHNSIQAWSSNTPSGLDRGNSGLRIENVTTGTSSGWKRHNEMWFSLGLSPNTRYGFRARARNGESVWTEYSPTIYRFTRALAPVPADFSGISDTSLQAGWEAGTNPAGTEYYCENVTAGTNSGWITAASWTSTGLTPETEHAFRVKARNGDGLETGWTALGTVSTLPADTGILITYPISGTINTVDDVNSFLGGTGISDTSTFTGSFSYDSSCTEGSSNSNGTYRDCFLDTAGISITIDEQYTFFKNRSIRTVVYNGFEGEYDRFKIAATATMIGDQQVPLDPPEGYSWWYNWLNVQVNDYDGSVFNDESLPVELDLSAFEYGYIVLRVSLPCADPCPYVEGPSPNSGPYFEIWGTIDLPAGPSDPPTVLYGVDTKYGTSGLSVIDTDTGESTVVGRLDPDGNPDPQLNPNRYAMPSSMAVRPSDGAIFVWSNQECAGTAGEPCGAAYTRELLVVDPATGAAARVGDAVAPTRPEILALAFDPSTEILYGFAGYTLCTIDAVTGLNDYWDNGIGVRTTDGHRVMIYGADFDAGGTLYAIGADPDAPPEEPDTMARLYTIDPATGTAGLIAAIPTTHIFTSIAFAPDGTLIGIRNTLLYDIDPATAALSNERVSGSAWQGLGFVGGPAVPPGAPDNCTDDPAKTEPGLCGCGVPEIDSDGDGTPDCIDACPGDPNKTVPGVCGCNTVDSSADTDGDGIPDCTDNCSGDPDKTDPGICGCGSPDADNDTDGVEDCLDNCPLTHNSSQADSDGDGIGDQCDGTPTTRETISIPAGAGVQAALPNVGINLFFEEVINPGETSVSLLTQAMDPPPGVRIIGKHYDITTSIDYSGPVEVCFSYDDTGLSGDQEQALQVLHYDLSHWEDATSSQNMNDNIICGTVAHFSDFAVALPLAPGADIDVDGDGFVKEEDCNDSDPAIRPGAVEICDGIDNNCDGDTDEGLTIDADGDGHSTPGSCEGTKDDCDDGSAAVNPSHAEDCDGIDNDCNGFVDEGLTVDADGDNRTTPGSCEGTQDDCDDGNAAINPSAEEICDGIDNNCNLEIDEGLTVDADGDNRTSLGSCVGTQDDCDDGNAAINPSAEEICDGIDNNCNLEIDEGLTIDADGDGRSTPESCAGTRDDCDDSDAAVSPSRGEVCDGKDNDCDGEIDEEECVDHDVELVMLDIPDVITDCDQNAAISIMVKNNTGTAETVQVILRRAEGHMRGSISWNVELDGGAEHELHYFISPAASDNQTVSLRSEVVAMYDSDLSNNTAGPYEIRISCRDDSGGTPATTTAPSTGGGGGGGGGGTPATTTAMVAATTTTTIVSPEPAPDCVTNSDCSDGTFCNGEELCLDGLCQSGDEPCGADEICMDELNECWGFEKLNAMALQKQIRRPRLRSERCTWLVLKSEKQHNYNDANSTIELRGPEEGSNGMEVNGSKKTFGFSSFILIPVCVSRDATAGEWSVVIETKISGPDAPFVEVLESAVNIQ